MLWRLDFIVNVKENWKVGHKNKQKKLNFDLLKVLSGCWTENQYKGGQLGGSCESPGIVA